MLCNPLRNKWYSNFTSWDGKNPAGMENIREKYGRKRETFIMQSCGAALGHFLAHPSSPLTTNFSTSLSTRIISCAYRANTAAPTDYFDLFGYLVYGITGDMWTYQWIWMKRVKAKDGYPVFAGPMGDFHFQTLFMLKFNSIENLHDYARLQLAAMAISFIEPRGFIIWNILRWHRCVRKLRNLLLYL